MIKKIAIWIYLISFANIFTDELNHYNEILEYTFNVGDNEDELKVASIMGGGPTQPSSILFDHNDNLLISDTINYRILVLNNNYSIDYIYHDNDEYYISSLTYLKEYGDYVWGASSSQIHLIMDKKNNKFAKLKIDRQIASKVTTKSIFIGNIFFSYLADGSICSFILSDKSELIFSEILLEDETLKMFSNREKYGLIDYELDLNKRLFYKGKILNRDYETIYQYWNELHQLQNNIAPRKIPGLPEFNKLEDIDAIYIGEDEDGNTYWDISQALLVIDENGWPLDYFLLDNLPIGLSSINSKGDVYYLSYAYSNEVQKLNLYKIDRQW